MAQAPKIPESEWLRVKTVIEQLYLTDGMKLEDVMFKLSAECGFNARFVELSLFRRRLSILWTANPNMSTN